MADEPELRAGISSEWVLYLQQLLNQHYQQSVCAESGEFDAALEDVVRYFQDQQGLPATGVVDAATWAALVGDASATASTPASDGAASSHAGGLQATGVRPDQVPASFDEGGAPACKYTWPEIPVATAVVDIGVALVELELTLTGESTVAFPDAASHATISQEGLTVSAGQALDGLVDQISVENLGSDEPRLSASVGSSFLQVSASPLDPASIEFSGSCSLDYEVDTDGGPAKVTGDLGYKLKVTVTPHVQRQEEPVYDTAPSWVESHSEELVAVGAVVLIAAVAIALAPETGGGSLVLAAGAL